MNRFNKNSLKSLLMVLSAAVLCQFTALDGYVQEGQCKPGHANESPMARQHRPIKLGVSGGSVFGNCQAGTLGSLVKDDCGKRYILSNTHVLALYPDVTIGDPISQPGALDADCLNISDNYVARLANWIPLTPFGLSFVDAAIAEVIPKKVKADGTILGIGTITKKPKTASFGQSVKKSGRTTGVTEGSIIAVNVTAVVDYGDFFTTFENQILIFGEGFSDAGDSGALVVENICKHPRPIGLLYTGNAEEGITLANPIQSVLDILQVEFVGVKKKKKKHHVHSKAREEKQLLAALLSQAMEVQNKSAPDLMQIPGVVGHAIGHSRKNSKALVLLVFVVKESNEIASQLPAEIDGLPVEMLQVGVLKPL